MPVTEMTVATDKTEYSRYNFNTRTITITGMVIAGQIAVGDSFVFSVRRTLSENWPEEHSALMTKTVVANQGHVTAQMVTCQLVVGSDDLDADFIGRALHSQYRVRIAHRASYWECTSLISIAIITTKEMRDEWCYGAPLKAMEVLGVKFQPRNITGFSIDEVSNGVVPGVKVFTLNYIAPVAPATTHQWTLQWDGGTPISISSPIRQQYLLLDETNINYMLVDINPAYLPRAKVVESLLVSELAMTDEMIQRRISFAIGSAESLLGFPMEPYLITTLPRHPGQQQELQHQVDHWDRIGRPADFIAPVDLMMWPTFRLPQQWCLKLHEIYGYHSTNKIVKVTDDWFATTVDRMSGLVSLVPSLGSFAQWQVYTYPLISPFYMRHNIPSFWQYTGIFGLPDLANDGRAPVRELIGRMGATSILMEAGRGYQGGLSGESTSRDGISSSRSFNPGGPYASTIQAHQQWIQAEAPRLKSKLGGVLIQMIGA